MLNKISVCVMAFISSCSACCDSTARLLGGGMSSSKVYEIDFLNQKEVIRLLDQGISEQQRKYEFEMHKFAAEKSLAPQINCVGEEDSPYFIIMKYIEGRNFSPEQDFGNKQIMKNIIDAIKHIHQAKNLTVTKKSMIELLAIPDGSVYPAALPNWIRNTGEESKKYPIEFVPIHGDLAPGNILISTDEKVYLIDFQEARQDSIFAELGYFFYESGIDDDVKIQSFLRDYLGREVNQEDMKHVWFYMKTTALLCGIYRLNQIDTKQYTTEDLDRLLKEKNDRGIDYFKSGDYDKMGLEGLDSSTRANYVLSFFRDYERMEKEGKL